MISGIFHTGGTTDFLSNLIPLHGPSYRSTVGNRAARSYRGWESGHASIAITAHVNAKWIPTARQAVVDVLNKPEKTQHAVAGLLSKRIRKRAEKSGKLGPQTIESNETNRMGKTLNQ
jgi:hypothetical protein